MKVTNHKFVVVAITQQDARIWADGLVPGTEPEHVHPPDEGRENHHIGHAQNRQMHDHANDPKFFELVAHSIKDAGAILLIGHGKGKANAMLGLIQFLERKHPDLAKKVISALDSDLTAMSEAQILKLAREWHDSHTDWL